MRVSVLIRRSIAKRFVSKDEAIEVEIAPERARQIPELSNRRCRVHG
jgi:hypothetical protein